MPPRLLFTKSILTLTAVLVVSINSASAVSQNTSLLASISTTPTFKQLMSGYRKNQPQQITLSGFQQLHSAQQEQADSWIAGDVNLVVHHENDALIDDNDTQNWQVGAEFPVWLPSQKQGASELAEAYQSNFVIEQAYLNWLASGAIRELIWDYQTALADVKIAQQTLETSQKLFDSIETQVRLGERPLMDSVLAEQTLLSHQSALIRQQSNLDIAKQAYQKWTGYTALPQSIIETPKETDLGQHPEVAKLQAQVTVSNVGLRQIESQQRGQPSLYLGAKQDQIQSQTETSLVMEVAIPLGMDSSFAVKKAQQQLHIQQQRATLQQAESNVVLKKQQIKQRLTQLQQGIELTNQQLNLAEKALDMSLKAYQLGEVSVHNLLLVQQQAINAKREAVLARHQLGQTIANYNQISGDILGATDR